MELHIGRVKVKILQGDLTDQDVDAIVIGTNDRLWMSGRLGDLVKRKAGEDVETEAMKQGPMQIGDVAITSAGELKNVKYILHTVIMAQDLQPTEQSIELGIKNVIAKAESLGIRSLAVSAFGTGKAEVPPETSAKSMLKPLIDALLDTRKIEEVRFILHNEGIFNTFVQTTEELFSRKK